MRFYLTYKDHGFYDPVVDDTEVIYIPVDPEELQIVNIQRNIHESQLKNEIIEFNQTGQPSTFVQPGLPSILVQPVPEYLPDPDIGELSLLINVDEIPKFRLPVSETYDPDGKRAKLNRIEGKAVVTFNVRNIVDEANEEKTRLQQQTQDAVSEYISENKINQNQEIKEDFIETYKETDLNVIRDKALEVVNESIDRGISVAKEINENVKTEIKTSENLAELITKELSKSYEEKLENVNIRKESIKNIEYDVNVSEEIKKFEKIETNESNIEERKLLTKQEIDEAIQSGTVRRTSEIFNKELSKPYRMEINKDYDSIQSERDESRSKDSSAKQRAFSIGLQTIPRIRENINPLQNDYRINLLTTFFLQLTNIMVTLSRFIATEPRTYLAQNSYSQSQDQRGFERKKEKTKLDKSNEQTFESFKQHEEGQGLSKYKYEHVSNDSEGEIIRKGKLSGAKIAQIEGRKTSELTDKMDIVISEFHKKSGFEEHSQDQSYQNHSGSRSKMKSESQKQQNTDHRKTYEEISETKTQSLDISETKSEKHSFETKTTKTEAKPYAYETTSTDGKKLTYVAIVEAHVYTNKEAIFEEQMRREREIKTQQIEQTKIDTNQVIRKLSLADTIIIPQSEEISVNEIEHKVSNIERAVTGIEQSTIKIAANKISEVLEPLVQQTHTFEEWHTTGLSQKIYPSLEKPTKSVVEITEITAEENESQNLEVLKLNIAKPKHIMENAKPIAETIVTSIKEDELGVLEKSKTQLQKPRQVVESMVKTVAETTEILTESNIDITFEEWHTTGLSQKIYPSLEKPTKSVVEITEITAEENESHNLEVLKLNIAKPQRIMENAKPIAETIVTSLKEDELGVLEKSKTQLQKPRQVVESMVKTVAETTEILTESNIDITPEVLVKTSHTALEGSLKVEQTANIKFDELKAVENTIIHLEEPGNHIFETPETKEKYPVTSMEDSHLKIAQVFTIIPEEPKDEHFEVSKITECKSSIDIVDIKTAETIVTRPEEPKYEQFEVLKIEEKIPESTFEEPSLKVAEIISTLSEEPKDEFYVPEFKNQQAGITIIEFKAAEATVVEAEESKQPELSIEQPKEKRLKQILEPSSLSVAVKTTEIVKTHEAPPTPPLSPTTPVVEEYMFSLETELEHPYVVEESVSEEASLKIKTQKKKAQTTQSADTTFTIAIENIVESGSETIEEIKEIENIHLSKEVHESMYEGYEVRKSNMSENIEVKSVDANQITSSKAHSLDTHHTLTLKNQTIMQDAINKTSLETNQNISTEADNLNIYKVSLESATIAQGESTASQTSHISKSSKHKSNKVKSSGSQYSAGQELKSSVKSMQSSSLEAKTEAESSQYIEASNKQLSISASKSMESSVMEGHVGLETHQHLRTASGSYKEDASKSVESKTFGAMETVSQVSAQVIKGETNASLTDEKLTLRTDLKSTISNDGQSSSPQPVPPTPLTDEYVFRLQTEMPAESTFIPRDCSISPESAHEDVVVNGLLTNYKTKIEERIIYNPPLPTPPTSPEKVKPVYTKPGLKGGSEIQELTKEEIHDTTLVSAIDRTLKQIEEYKASVGLTTEEMSYHQEDIDKEFIPIEIVEECLDNEVHNTASSQAEEGDAIKITVIAEENNAGETAVTIMTEKNVDDDDDDDLEIQEISSTLNEISLEIENGRVLREQLSSENQIDDFKPVQMNPEDNLEVHEEDYEWVAVHPSSLNKIGADDGSVTTDKSESEVLNEKVQKEQIEDKSKELIMQHDQEIIGDEAIIPPVESLKDSEVIKLLNEERNAVEERKWTTFLQKKYSPTPKTEVVYYGDFDIKTQIIPDAYKVKIVKQPKPKIAPDWKDKELKKESSPIIKISVPQATEEPEIEDKDIIEKDNIIKEDNHIEEDNNLIVQEENVIEEDAETKILEEVKDKETEELELEEMAQRNLAEELIQNVENMIDVNASTDQQLEQMRDQLAALAQLPSVIQRTVELVHKRINMISEKEKQKKEEEEEYRRQEEEHRRQEEEYRRQEEEQREELERAKHSLELRVTKTEEELEILKKEAMKRRYILDEKQKKEKVELMKIDQVSRQVTQRSNPRVGRPTALYGQIQERPVILPGGRKWRTVEDVYDEEFITDTLVGQAEVIKGSAIGVNFMKFDKPPPALDHLKHSEVFKAIHNIEPPTKKVELLGPVLSDADYREKARSMSPCVEKVAEFSGTKQS